MSPSPRQEEQKGRWFPTPALASASLGSYLLPATLGKQSGWSLAICKNRLAPGVDWQGFSVQWELRPCGTLVLCGSDEVFYHVTWLACQNMH